MTSGQTEQGDSEIALLNEIHFRVFSFLVVLTSFNNQFFIYSRPIAGIRAKMEHETSYLQ